MQARLPPNYEIALMASRPSTPELARLTDNDLIPNSNAHDDELLPCYEAAISLNNSAASSRTSSIDVRFKPGNLPSRSAPLLA